MRGNRAFTLIELMVVISMIALLIAILLPVLGSVNETARRAQCASNTESINSITETMALDNGNTYRLTHRQLYTRSDTFVLDYEGLTGTRHKQTDHIHWLNRFVFIDFIERGADFSRFTCPSRVNDFVYGEASNPFGGSGTDVEDVRNARFQRIRTMYYVMAGRSQALVGSAKGFPNKRWIAPMSNEDAPELPLAACVLEQYTSNPYPRASYPHGPGGYLEPAPDTPPDKAGSQGGNVSYNDGSTEFVPTSDSTGFAAAISGGSGSRHMGYWPDVRPYNNP